MSYWISETGTNRMPGNVKSFYCDFRSDIPKLPKNGVKGDLSAGDTSSAQPCRYGSDCLCLEDSSVWILGKATNEWKDI